LDVTAVGKQVLDLFRADVRVHLSSISPRTRQAHPLGRPRLRAEVLQKMDALFTEVDTWTTTAALAVSIQLGWGFGWWRGRRRPQGQREAPASKFHDPILALLGLMLAFTFSMSLAKHDQRRLMVVTDNNAIGDFYTSASLVKEPLRGKLQGAIREYVELRLALVKDRITEADLQKAQELQNRLLELVGAAVDGGTSVVVPLVNTLNKGTSSHAARLAADCGPAGGARCPHGGLGLRRYEESFTKLPGRIILTMLPFLGIFNLLGHPGDAQGREQLPVRIEPSRRSFRNSNGMASRWTPPITWDPAVSKAPTRR
jgi:hypothetical protein